jgi:hydrogenase/urease accessory protein HupE
MCRLSKSNPFLKIIFCLLLFLPIAAIAHPVSTALEKAPAGDVIWFYLKLGISHIIPSGLDHILFIVALCLLNTKIKTIIWQATAFTVAHSITLALSMKGIIFLPSGIVEPIIALSILFVAVENILISDLKPWRILIVFLFGLIHGMGFAAALGEIGLPRNRFFTSIISFNAGVEVGQIIVIILAYLLLIYPLGRKTWYKKAIVYPISGLIALIALYWSIERIF